MPNCIIDNNEAITDPTKISNKFNNYFSGIAQTILNKRKYHGNKQFTDFLKDPIPDFMEEDFLPTNEREVIDLISQLNPKKVMDPMVFLPISCSLLN